MRRHSTRSGGHATAGRVVQCVFDVARRKKRESALRFRLSRRAVFSYPQGTFEGRLNGLYYYGTKGECVDGQGDVFVLNVAGPIYEYAHGALRYFAKLATPFPASACVVDPTTGNLAATMSNAVAIYKNARGKPRLYWDAKFSGFAFCDYDASGNLFVDGQNLSYQFALVELPSSSTHFVPISLNQNIYNPGGVLWDGKDLVIGDQSSDILYRFSIAGTSGREVGVTALKGGARGVRQFRIRDRRVIVPAAWFKTHHPFKTAVLYYDYPQGGEAIQEIHKRVVFTSGAVVSLAHP